LRDRGSQKREKRCRDRTDTTQCRQ
jgi:hypothetical protein